VQPPLIRTTLAPGATHTSATLRAWLAAERRAEDLLADGRLEEAREEIADHWAARGEHETAEAVRTAPVRALEACARLVRAGRAIGQPPSRSVLAAAHRIGPADTERAAWPRRVDDPAPVAGAPLRWVRNATRDALVLTGAGRQIACLPLYRLPDDHPAWRGVAVGEYLRRERYYQELRGESAPVVSLSDLRARRGVSPAAA
jgi:hypothetical protein